MTPASQPWSLGRQAFATKKTRLLVLTIAFAATLLSVGCRRGSDKPVFTETILDGKQFAHYVHFPSKFVRTSAPEGPDDFDHYSFWVSPPDKLLVAACEYFAGGSGEACSSNVFVVDTAHAYAVREAHKGEWQAGIPVRGSMEMDYPFRKTMKEELAKPSDQMPQPLGSALGEDGYQYRTKAFRRRGEWIRVISFGHSEDGQLAILTGADKRRLPKSGTIFPDPVYAGAYGRYTLDIFDVASGNRMAAVDIDCAIRLIDGVRRASLINSRWFAIGLDGELRKMLLFDFQSSEGGQAQ